MLPINVASLQKPCVIPPKVIALDDITGIEEMKSIRECSFEALRTSLPSFFSLANISDTLRLLGVGRSEYLDIYVIGLPSVQSLSSFGDDLTNWMKILSRPSIATVMNRWWGSSLSVRPSIVTKIGVPVLLRMLSSVENNKARLTIQAYNVYMPRPRVEPWRRSGRSQLCTSLMFFNHCIYNRNTILMCNESTIVSLSSSEAIKLPLVLVGRPARFHCGLIYFYLCVFSLTYTQQNM